MVQSVNKRLSTDPAEAHKQKAGLLDVAFCRTDMLWVKLICKFQ